MKITYIFLAVILALFSIDVRLQGCAQTISSEQQFLVTADWLKQNMNDSKVVLLHIGQRAEYDAGHIAGASYISVQDISAPPSSEPDSLSLELPTVDRLRTVLVKSGVSNDSRIILYFGKDWVSPTTRVYYTLDIFGLGGNTSILDGGMPAWVAAGGALSKDIPDPKPGVLNLVRDNKRVATADLIKANLKKDDFKIVDARTSNYYDGSSVGHMAGIGHIAGAKSIPFNTLTDENNKLKADRTLRKMFDDAGVKPYDDVVTYCHIGQQATAVYFAARKLGYKVALYDGSFQEWSRLPDAPIVNLSGAPPEPKISLVTPEWVEQHSTDKNVRVIDVRQNVYDYFAGHVPGAVHLADAAMRYPFEGYPTQYPDVNTVGQLFSRGGVKKTDKVVLYSEGDNVLGATMMAYLLERIGHSDIAIVDGGWRDYSVTRQQAQEYPQYKAEYYDGMDNRSVRATIDDVKAAIGKDTVKFIDARPPNVYRGEVKTWVRNGHIPGAYSIPWKSLVEENNSHKMKPVADLRAVFAAKGFKESDDIVVYCGTSREASIEYFVLRHLLKFPKVRLFEGSWAEYSNHPSLPVEIGGGR